MLDSFFKPNIEKLQAKRDVPGLIKALGHKDDYVRQGASKALSEIGDPSANEALILALKDQNRYVRKIVSEALGQIGDPRAVEPLIAALLDNYWEVRNAAADALGQIGDIRAIEPLIDMLGDSDNDLCEAVAGAMVKIGSPAVEPLIAALKIENVRKTVVGVLGQIGDPSAVESLILVLKDADDEVRRAAAGALDEIGWHPSQDESGAAYWVTKRKWDKCIEIGKPAIRSLIAALNERDAVAGASGALGQIGDARAVGPLIEVLKNNRDGVFDATGALGQIGDARAVEPLVAILKNSNNDVRKAAAGALGQIGIPAIKPLISALKNGNSDIRQAAASALVKIGTPAVEPLIGVLKGSDIRAAADALGQIGDARAIESLIVALKDGSNDMRQTAAGALVKIGPPAVEPLIEALKDSDMRAAVDVLDMIGWQPSQDENGVAYWVIKRRWDKCVEIGALAVEPLIAALQNSKDYVRKSALVALGQIGDARAAQPLMQIAMLKDSDSDVSEAAVKSLGQIGAPAVEFLVFTLNHENWTMRAAASELLGQLGDLHSAGALIAKFGDEKREVRRAAAEALDLLKWEPDKDTNLAYWIITKQFYKCIEIGASAVEPLIAELKDSNEGIGLSLIDALSGIGEPAIEPLISVLTDSRSEVRSAAAQSLGQIGDSRVVRNLIEVLKDSDNDVRSYSAKSLGQIGDPHAVEPLIDLLIDKSSSVRLEAAWSLGQIGDSRAVEPLIVTLTDSNSEVRSAVAKSLGQIGSPYAVGPLIGEIKDIRENVRETVTEALGELGDSRAIGPLIDALRDRNGKIRQSAAKGLTKIGAPAAANLRLVLGNIHEDKIVRMFAAEMLGQIGDTHAIMPLCAMLEDENGELRRAGAKALVAIYRFQITNEKTKAIILKFKETISMPHTDGHSDSPDSEGDKCYSHFDGHRDTGIGVYFPL